ncbi:MAG: CpaF family protein [Acidimicrobiia bacterium]|nr:CpaF family protein [Acidimicrobiia bacterium]
MTSAPNAYETIRQRSLEKIDAEKLDPSHDVGRINGVVANAVDEYQALAHQGALGRRALRDPAEMVRRVLRSITRYGALTDLFERPEIEEVFIEGDRVTYIDGDGRLQSLTAPTSEEENAQVVSRMLAATDRHLDTSSPIVQARVLEDSARLTAVIPPISDQLSATVRRYALRQENLSFLVEKGSLTPQAAGFLWAVMKANTSVLVSGPPGAGKTSMLSALLDSAPANHCIRCVEEVRELHVPLSPHSSYYEARPPGLDGRGEITLRSLVKLVLAMRPDRIVVGEVRAAEAFELTRASNAGCGFACTIHANSARDALNALVNAALMAGENVTEEVVRKVFSSTIDFVVHLDRDATTYEGQTLRRQTMEVLALNPSLHDDFTTEPLFHREEIGRPLQWTGQMPNEALTKRIDAALPEGFDLRAICDGTVTPL